MVHIYSFGYMKGENGFQRYYAFLSLFTFSMLGLVVATNIFQMYVFWELVGVSSYLLIGFYYTKPEAIAASKKAFIVTRFADLGFLIGILIYGYYMQTFTFTPGEERLMQAGMVLPWALGLMFVGGAGKSAMFPLHIWLPDAMEGPTPVSALIHAATMVVAGVYLVARMFPLFIGFAPHTLHMVAYVGAFTAFYAASVACAQSDIKRVLAFSTISQIGFMMVALGVCTAQTRMKEVWDTWQECSTCSLTPCSKPCCSWEPDVLSTPYTATKCRPWEDFASICLSLTLPSSLPVWPLQVYLRSLVSSQKTKS